jgi:hypothetical protein
MHKLEWNKRTRFDKQVYYIMTVDIRTLTKYSLEVNK